MTALLLPSVSAAQVPVSDAEALSALLTKAVNSLIDDSGVGTQSTVFSSYGGALSPNKLARDSFDAALTAKGFLLSDVRKNADLTMSLAISNADITLIKSAEDCHRSVSLTVYVNCVNGNGMLIFSDSKSLTINDTVLTGNLKATNDSGAFAKGLKRSIAEKKKNTTMILSLALLASALAIFAEQ